MGQRHQFIISTPKRTDVIHHQWLYGRSAIFALERVIKYCVNYDGYNGLAKSHNAIAAAISIDPDSGYYHSVYQYSSLEDYNPYNKVQELEPNDFDNNDGITLIQIDKDNQLKVAYITPSHLEGGHWNESDGFGPWTPEQYLNFYYNAGDIQEWDDEMNPVIEALARAFSFIKSNTKSFTANEVANLLPNFPIKGDFLSVVSINKNKPTRFKRRVDSSSIFAIEYRSGNLTVEFNNGSKYRYYNLDLDTAMTLLNSDSVGKYFNHKIRGQFDSKLIKKGM